MRCLFLTGAFKTRQSNQHDLNYTKVIEKFHPVHYSWKNYVAYLKLVTSLKFLCPFACEPWRGNLIDFLINEQIVNIYLINYSLLF